MPQDKIERGQFYLDGTGTRIIHILHVNKQIVRYRLLTCSLVKAIVTKASEINYCWSIDIELNHNLETCIFDGEIKLITREQMEAVTNLWRNQ